MDVEMQLQPSRTHHPTLIDFQLILHGSDKRVLGIIEVKKNNKTLEIEESGQTSREAPIVLQN